MNLCRLKLPLKLLIMLVFWFYYGKVYVERITVNGFN